MAAMPAEREKDTGNGVAAAAVRLYTAARSDEERLAALLLLTRAPPPTTPEARSTLRNALGLGFAARLLRTAPPPTAASEKGAAEGTAAKEEHEEQTRGKEHGSRSGASEARGAGPAAAGERHQTAGVSLYQTLGMGVLALLHAPGDDEAVLAAPALVDLVPDVLRVAAAAIDALPPASRAEEPVRATATDNAETPPTTMQTRAGDGHVRHPDTDTDTETAAEPETGAAAASGVDASTAVTSGVADQAQVQAATDETTKGEKEAGTAAEATEVNGATTSADASPLSPSAPPPHPPSPAEMVLSDALALLSTMAAAPAARTWLLQCGAAELLPRALTCTPDAAAAEAGLRCAVLLALPSGTGPRATTPALLATVRAVAGALWQRQDEGKVMACEALTALLQGVATTYPSGAAARLALAGDTVWQHDAAAALLRLLQHRLGPELRGPVFAAAAACCDIAGAGWCLAVADKKEQRGEGQGEESAGQEQTGAARGHVVAGGRLAPLQLLARLAAVELRMQLEEPDPAHGLAEASLVFSCFATIEAVLLYLVEGGDALASEEAWNDIYGAVKTSVSAVLMLLEAVVEAAWSKETLSEEQSLLLRGAARLLGAWAAEETDALQLEVALGCATLCALLPEAEMLACLVPGLYNLAFHEDARALLLRTDAVMHALAAILQANNERSFAGSSATAANLLLHLTYTSAKELALSPAFPLLHAATVAVVGVRFHARRQPEAHAYLCLALLHWLTHAAAADVAAADVSRALGGVALVLAAAEAADAGGWLSAVLAALDSAAALAAAQPEAQRQLAEAASVRGGVEAVAAVAEAPALVVALQEHLLAGPHAGVPEVVAAVAMAARRLSESVPQIVDGLALDE